jgi:hypothetical protein
MTRKYDSSWNKGSIKAFHKKEEEWEGRNWVVWLNTNLQFPFMVKRMEDEDDAYFTDIAKHKPFRLGHKMKVTDKIDIEGDYGIIIKVQEEQATGYVPLRDVEVRPKNDPNYWPVKEYVVWFANR